MSFNLISEADYERLPADPHKKFAALEAICRRNMFEAMTPDTSADSDTLVRTTYMTVVAAAAEELGVTGVSYVSRYAKSSDNVQEFIRVVSGVVAKIYLRNSSGRDALSVRLANKTKGIIESEIAKLRNAVSMSDLDEAKQKKLLAKLEEFRTELHKDRLSYGIAFSTLAMIAAGTAMLADAPPALNTIFQLIGYDKEKEEAEIFRLEAPTKPALLTAPDNGVSVKTSRHINDEDIPF